jgi:hypothetical protein
MGDIQAFVRFPDQLKNYWYDCAQSIIEIIFKKEKYIITKFIINRPKEAF